MTKSRYDSTRAWYAINTYSGHEDKVSDAIRQRANGVDMADKIFDAIVPKEKQIEIKNGKRKVIERKIFQGYVLVEMKLTDETWYIIRNTPGVTGFVGNDSRRDGVNTPPVPISEKEIAKIKKRMGVEDPKYTVNFSVGETVNIIDGPFKGFDGSVAEIDQVKGKIRVMVDMFGRDTSVELDALQVQKMS